MILVFDNYSSCFHPERLICQAGQDIVADGTPESAKRIERVLTTDPGMGVVRYVDAGYEEAVKLAEKNDVKIPMRK